ncbi:hypothetical protein ACPV4Z_18315 [Vibrio aestuarianus]|uniref:hypothetical protein n=1 Tax=Vibrio aestuarianus TaxID=28171 RepID=UPI004068BDD5
MSVYLTKSKSDQYIFLGQPMNEQYLLLVQIPMLLDALHWSPSMVYKMLQDVDAPIRHSKLIQYRNELIEQQEKDAKEQAEREAHRRANYPTPEEHAEDMKLKAQRKAEKQEYIRKMREFRSGVSSSSPYETTQHVATEW